MTNSTVWRLQAGQDRRFRSGHPWVYSNELSHSPKGIEPGAPIELVDAAGKFLARGFGNPSSLIAFRAMTRNPEDTQAFSPEGLVTRLRQAREVRDSQGWGDSSYRLVFGEADRLPGLIVDRFVEKRGVVFVAQAHTAGADRLLAWLPDALRSVFPESSAFALVIRNEASVRKLEGLPIEEARLAVKGFLASGEELKRSSIRVKPGLEFTADLWEGQKTGFFLDQSGNIELVLKRLDLKRLTREGRPLRVVDLCCYVGQWSSQIAKAAREAGVAVEVTLVDASAQALELARANAERQGAKVKALEKDVLKDLGDLETGSFDLVISDPPALIKGRKDVGPGTHAYLQLHTQAVRLVRDGGALVACSCSALLEEEEFLRTLGKAASRNRSFVRWIARGGQGADHPMLAEFPEGRYLKAWLGIVTRT